ncbi:MAG: hypothetical protein GY703_01350 [Gammaproteobacteria bacterium]|nr:hypothetical protein [Gammaproteobacteria bacterium]
MPSSLVPCRWIAAIALSLLTLQAHAAEFHVTNAQEFQTALATAIDNGQDDVIHLVGWGSIWAISAISPRKPMG